MILQTLLTLSLADRSAVADTIWVVSATNCEAYLSDPQLSLLVGRWPKLMQAGKSLLAYNDTGQAYSIRNGSLIPLFDPTQELVKRTGACWYRLSAHPDLSDYVIVSWTDGSIFHIQKRGSAMIWTKWGDLWSLAKKIGISGVKQGMFSHDLNICLSPDGRQIIVPVPTTRWLFKSSEVRDAELAIFDLRSKAVVKRLGTGIPLFWSSDNVIGVWKWVGRAPELRFLTPSGKVLFKKSGAFAAMATAPGRIAIMRRIAGGQFLVTLREVKTGREKSIRIHGPMDENILSVGVQ